MRLDSFLTLNNYAESRNKASMLINEGSVFVNGKCITKPSTYVDESADIKILSQDLQYVARSAKKLVSAIDAFGLNFKEKVAVDFGASTGGFCEVMLKNGIKHIYAVDIGTNQLHPKIKLDKRVTNIEHTNARFVTRADFPEDIDFITCDLSFISLKLVLSAVFCTLKNSGEFVCLIKPQFEAGKEFLGKNGVVKDRKVQAEVVYNIASFAADTGFCVKDVAFSGLEGESGNREYLLYMLKNGETKSLDREYINKIVIGD